MDLQNKAGSINASEQLTKSQRDVRQTEGYSKALQRSLSELVGEHHVFAHLHMWFVFLLRAEIFRNIPLSVPECPVECPTAKDLRDLQRRIPNYIFKTLAYCVLTGVKVEQQDTDILKHFYQLLPIGFVLPTAGSLCYINKVEDSWEINFKGSVPQNLPTLLQEINNALSNEHLPDAALSYHLMSLIMRWFNVACVLSWAPLACEKLMRSLELRKCDMPLLSYWIPQSKACVKLAGNDWLERFKLNDLSS